MKMMRQTRILGLRTEKRINEMTGGMDQYWVKPEPVSYAMHFKNMAMKRKVQANPQEYANRLESVFYRVPIYNGIDSRLLKYLRSRYKYAQKLASPEWQAGRLGAI